VAERRNSMGAVPDPDLAFAIAADEVVLGLRLTPAAHITKAKAHGVRAGNWLKHEQGTPGPRGWRCPCGKGNRVWAVHARLDPDPLSTTGWHSLLPQRQGAACR
jgi:hypothetical protein